jgi:hypothetical protein
VSGSNKRLAYTALPGVKDLEEKFEKRQQKRMRVIKQFFEYQKSIKVSLQESKSYGRNLMMIKNMN